MRLWDDAKALRRVTLWLYTFIVVAVCVAGFKWVWDSPYFPIQKIQFYGELKETNREKLAAVAQRNINGNFFKADMNLLKQALVQDQWVESVRVQRLWPDTVNVFVQERQAYAIRPDGKLIDANGHVFNAKTQKPLPEFSGPEYMMPKVVAFERKMRPLLQQQQLQVKQLDVSERGAWTMTLQNGVVLKLGRRDLDFRLKRFAQYWQRDLLPLADTLQYVDLRYHDGFAVKHNGAATKQAEQGNGGAGKEAVASVANQQNNESNIN